MQREPVQTTRGTWLSRAFPTWVPVVHQPSTAGDISTQRDFKMAAELKTQVAGPLGTEEHIQERGLTLLLQEVSPTFQGTCPSISVPSFWKKSFSQFPWYYQDPKSLKNREMGGLANSPHPTPSSSPSKTLGDSKTLGENACVYSHLSPLVSPQDS